MHRCVDSRVPLLGTVKGSHGGGLVHGTAARRALNSESFAEKGCGCGEMIGKTRRRRVLRGVASMGGGLTDCW